MGECAIYFYLLMIWVVVILITAVAVFGEDERSRESKASFEWIAYDRLLVSTHLRRYRHGNCGLSSILRARSPPLMTYWS